MIKIFIPQEKSKQNKTNIRGFWKNPFGKIYYDYLYIKQEVLPIDENKFFGYLKEKYNQEAIFYIENNQAFIFNNSKNIQKLSQKIVAIVQKDKEGLKKYIKKFLNLYSGVTVYIDELCYKLEAWTV